MAVIVIVVAGFSRCTVKGMAAPYRAFFPSGVCVGNSSVFKTFLDGGLKTLFTRSSKTHRASAFPSQVSNGNKDGNRSQRRGTDGGNQSPH